MIALRRRQAKNLFALLLLANGLPMFLSGDEFLHTQRGNNNPYNQDNETTWLDWSRLAQNGEHFRFCKKLIEFRRAHPTLCRNRFWRKDVRWFGADNGPDLGENSRAIAYYLSGASHGDVDLYVMINGWWEPLSFEIQEGRPGEWKRVMDTGLPSPADLVDAGDEPVLLADHYELGPRSVVVLIRS